MGLGLLSSGLRVSRLGLSSLRVGEEVRARTVAAIIPSFLACVRRAEECVYCRVSVLRSLASRLSWSLIWSRWISSSLAFSLIVGSGSPDLGVIDGLYEQ